ncbi:MAG: group II intron maturase-specific domain-containing protein [Gammaproteobacteria bacterium]
MQAIHANTHVRTGLLETDVIVERLNRKLVGWANYFHLGPVHSAYRALDSHVTDRLRRWLCKKHKLKGAGTKRFPDEYLYDSLGLARLTLRTQTLPWAAA